MKVGESWRWEGDPHSPIWVVGEIWTPQGDRSNKAFTGDAEVLLKEVLKQKDISLAEVAFTNVANEVLAQRRVVTPAEFKVFRSKLIEQANVYKPKVIVSCGAKIGSVFIPTSKGLEAYRGTPYWNAEFNAWILPTHHPGGVTYKPETFYTFASDIGKIASVLELEPGRSLIPDFGHTVIRTREAYQQYKERILCPEDNCMAVDIETDGFDFMMDDILSIGIGPSANHVYIFAKEFIEDPDNHELLNAILSQPDITYIYQNGKFDVKFLRANPDASVFGKRKKCVLPDVRCDFDTMMAHYNIDERQGTHGLKVWAAEEFSAPDWDADIEKYLPNKQSKYSLIPEEELYKYQAYDIYYTRKGYAHFLKKMQAEDTEECFRNIHMPAVEAFTQIELEGIPIDYQRLKTMFDEGQPRIAAAKEKLSEAAVAVGWNPSAYTVAKNLANIKKWEAANAHLAPTARAPMPNKAACPTFFNPNSHPQLSYVGYDLCGVPLFEGKKTCSKDAVDIYRHRHPFWKVLAEYKEVNDLFGTFIKGMLERVGPDHRIRPDFLLHGTKTGRISCIAEGTQILCINGTKPIEKVKIGDWVYGFKEDGSLTLSQVKNTYFQGIQETLTLKWKSSSGENTGELCCTPDHKIRTYSGWKEAQELTFEDQLFHAKRTYTPSDPYPVIYSTGDICIQEHVFIGQELFGITNSKMFSMHHLDGKKSNNELSNLCVMLRKEHNRLHSKENASIAFKLSNVNGTCRGTSKGKYSNVTAETILQWLEEVQGCPSKLPIDYETFQKLCIRENIDYRKICAEYGNFRYNRSPNHRFVSKRNSGLKRVYDLEIDGPPNFIANEICVHNCTNPNMQNLPRGSEIKDFFIADPGCVVVNVDYKTLEVMVAAILSGDQEMQKPFIEHLDFHSETTNSVFAKDLAAMRNACDTKNVAVIHEFLERSLMMEIRHDIEKMLSQNEFNAVYDKIYGHLRFLTKFITFGIMYGRGAQSLAEGELNCSTLEASQYVDMFFAKYPTYKKWLDNQFTTAKKLGYVQNMFGFKRRWPFITADVLHEIRNQSWNTPIQGSASMICMQALCRTQSRLKKLGYGRALFTVHDSIVYSIQKEHLNVALDLIHEELVRPVVETPVQLEVDIEVGSTYKRLDKVSRTDDGEWLPKGGKERLQEIFKQTT